MNVRSTIACATVCGALLSLGLAAPAMAQSQSYTDKTKDITKFGGAKHGVADIKKLRITHTKYAFTAVVKFKKLTRTNWSSIYVGTQGNTPSSYPDIAMSVKVNGGPYSGKVWVSGDADAPPHCNADVELKYGKNGWAKLSAPRHCFADGNGKLPRKLRSYATVYKTTDGNRSGASDAAPYNRFGKWAKKG